MKVFETAHIRNVAVVGHGGCGKTTLVSAILFDTGAVNRLGRVEDGSTVTDFDPDEIERKISLQTAMAWGEWRKAKVNFLDAPGYANFLSEARSAQSNDVPDRVQPNAAVPSSGTTRNPADVDCSIRKSPPSASVRTKRP